METVFFGTDGIAIKRAQDYGETGCRRFYGSLSDIPKTELSTTLFIVISGQTQCRKDFESLCSLGINPYLISFYENLEWRRGCSFLGQFLWFGRSYYRSCVYRCGDYLNVDYSGDIANDYKLISQKWNEVIERWRNNESTPCDNCVRLTEQLWPRTPKLRTLSLYGGFRGERCNARCIYCDSTDNLKMAKCPNSPTMVDAIKDFIDIKELHIFSIALSAGEITVSPYKSEIFELLNSNGIKASIFSNGLLFEPYIYDSLHNHQGSLNISLDAGTPETFHKIKGINRFQRVVENIARYSESQGKVELKYIFIEGINDNIKDVDGFLAICKKYASTVRVSCDKFRYKNRLSVNAFNLIRVIVEKCKEYSLPLAFSYSQFNDDDCIKLKELL